ncbi:hypothetical protein GCM10011572_23440 [Pseudoduganella buxea]|uniref:Uncharacterized protein n=1 Tax=Pseudoduganella buxea TaxID=1949069 RepID=A0ABQ1KHU5_9BURK|nr:hypothetical protein GCM10011572_23440 [Pseudoduganella buxea]
MLLVRLRVGGRRVTGDGFHAAEPPAGRLILRLPDKFQNGGASKIAAPPTIPSCPNSSMTCLIFTTAAA